MSRASISMWSGVCGACRQPPPWARSRAGSRCCRVTPTSGPRSGPHGTMGAASRDTPQGRRANGAAGPALPTPSVPPPRTRAPPPMRVLRLVTLNPARYFGFADVGEIAVGMRADLNVLSDLTEPTPLLTIARGRGGGEGGRLSGRIPHEAMSPDLEEA